MRGPKGPKGPKVKLLILLDIETSIDLKITILTNDSDDGKRIQILLL